MSKARVCPHCGETIPLDCGFHFDENLNLIHDKCGKIVFSATPAHDGVTTNYRRSHRGQNALIPLSGGGGYTPNNYMRQEYTKFDIDT